MKYRVYAVYSGCNAGEEIVDTLEEAKAAEERLIQEFIDDFGEEVLHMGIGDYCTYIEKYQDPDQKEDKKRG